MSLFKLLYVFVILGDLAFGRELNEFRFIPIWDVCIPCDTIEYYLMLVSFGDIECSTCTIIQRWMHELTKMFVMIMHVNLLKN